MSVVRRASSIASSGNGGAPAAMEFLARPTSSRRGHQQDEADDEQCGPERDRLGEPGRGRSHKEAQGEHGDDRRARPEANSDPDLRDLLLDLEQGQLDLEPDDRTNAVDDLFRSAADPVRLHIGHAGDFTDVLSFESSIQRQGAPLPRAEGSRPAGR